jgi:hypothetical protein
MHGVDQPMPRHLAGEFQLGLDVARDGLAGARQAFRATYRNVRQTDPLETWTHLPRRDRDPRAVRLGEEAAVRRLDAAAADLVAPSSTL